MFDIFQVKIRVVLEGLKLGFRQAELKNDNALLIDVIRNGLIAVNNIDEIRMIHE